MRQVEVDLILECRGCGSIIYKGERNITIKPDDLIVFINKLRKGSCPLCSGPRSPRYTKNLGRKRH